jgi:hypothetical protein
MQYDLEALNSRLADIQGEISHINQMKNATLQKPSAVLKITTVPPEQSSTTATSCDTSTTASPNSRTSLKITNRKSAENLNENGAFFIAFNNGVHDSDQIKHVNNERPKSAAQQSQQIDEQVKQLILIDEFSCKDEDEMERRRELIITRQIQRKQEQEQLRQQREEERMRIAEEQRMREEEANMKKQIEKTRKNAIFQAYMDKKKQLVDEAGGVMGKPIRTVNKIKNSASQHRLQQPQQLQLQQNDYDFEMNERTIQQATAQCSSKSKSSTVTGPTKFPSLETKSHKRKTEPARAKSFHPLTPAKNMHGIQLRMNLIEIYTTMRNIHQASIFTRVCPLF